MSDRPISPRQIANNGEPPRKGSPRRSAQDHGFFEPSKNAQRKHGRRRLFRIAYRLGGLLLLLAVLCVGTFYAVGALMHAGQWVQDLPGLKNTPLADIKFTPPGSPSDMIILVMGVDKPPVSPEAQALREGLSDMERVRSDTMMLVRISPEKNTVSIVSIPRDSKVFIGKGRRIDKINSAYVTGGADLAVSTVQRTLGIPVTHYLAINSAGIEEVVDALGGVELFIEKPMHYVDKSDGLVIDFEPGTYQLDGQQAEAYLRFRHDKYGDIGRIARQQRFISAAMKRAKDPWVLPKLPHLVGVVNQHIETNLSANQLFQLAWFARGLKPHQIRTSTLPGRSSQGPGASYWLIYPRLAEKLVNRLILDHQTTEHTSTLDPIENPLQVGILYNEALEEHIDAFSQQIEAQGFSVKCTRAVNKQSTQVVEHSYRVNDHYSEALRAVAPATQTAPLVFSPGGTTFEVNYCRSREDYTLILGDDVTPETLN